MDMDLRRSRPNLKQSTLAKIAAETKTTYETVTPLEEKPRT